MAEAVTVTTPRYLKTPDAAVHRAAQAVATGQLPKRHAAEPVLTAEALHRPVAAETLDAAAETMKWQMIHQLREYDLALVHPPTPHPHWMGTLAPDPLAFKSVTASNAPIH